MSKGRYLRWIVYLFFALFFIYQGLNSSILILRYVNFLVGILEVNMLIFEIGIYNYHKGNLVWLNDD